MKSSALAQAFRRKWVGFWRSNLKLFPVKLCSGTSLSDTHWQGKAGRGMVSGLPLPVSHCNSFHNFPNICKASIPKVAFFHIYLNILMGLKAVTSRRGGQKSQTVDGNGRIEDPASPPFKLRFTGRCRFNL